LVEEAETVGLLYGGGRFFSADLMNDEIGLTESSGSSILSTQCLLSRLNVRRASVRPCLNNRVRTVSYVAVNSPRVLYHASCHLNESVWGEFVVACWGKSFNWNGKREAEEERNEPSDFIQLLPNLSNHK